MVITIDEELYDKIKGSAIRNKSRSSIIYLPDDNENMRRYKVNLDINNNLYIMKDKVKAYIFTQSLGDGIGNYIIENQIAYIKDELNTEQKEKWDRLLSSKQSTGLKMWIDIQLKNKTEADKILKNTLNLHKERCKQRLAIVNISKNLKSCMDVLVSIIKFDIENIDKNFETYKNDLSEALTQAEEKTNDSKYVLYNPITKEKLKHESAYIKYCEQAKIQFDCIEEMVKISHLDPYGPPSELWDESN